MKRIIFIVCVLVILAGCGGTDVVPEQPLEDIYTQAYAEFNKKNYDTAAEKFSLAETQYPTSPWAADALVMAAYSLFGNRSTNC